MPITKGIQRRGRQIGEIRIGEQVDTGRTRTDGSKIMRPAKRESFRFTTRSPNVAQAVAAALGGTAVETTLANGRPTWEVSTDATQLAVMVPPGDAAISQWFELWTAAGCARRCDGETEQLTQTPCKCPLDPAQRVAMSKAGDACRPVTRVNIMLPDIPDLGVWLLSSNGFYAASELGGAAEVLAAARAAGVIVPATLRLEQRQIKRLVDGKATTHNFAVPVLEIGSTLRDLTALTSGTSTIAGALPPPPGRAIGAGPSRGLPGADAVEGEVVADVVDFANAQQIADAAADATSKDEVLALGKAMVAKGWGESVAQLKGGGEATLREYLLARLAAIEAES